MEDNVIQFAFLFTLDYCYIISPNIIVCIFSHEYSIYEFVQYVFKRKLLELYFCLSKNV